MARSGSILGNAVRRKEDPGVLRGETQYFDDLAVDGLAHVVFVRSNVAHARLGPVDTSEAVAMPGVLGVYTVDNLELPDQQGFAMLPPVFNRPPLARGVVRFVGDVIAAVVAETRAQAVDAAELVIVDYDPLPVVIDPERALAADAPVVFPEHGSNLAFEMNFGTDPTVFDGADVVVSAVFYNQRLAGVPMEGNGIVAVPGAPEGGLTAWIPTQAPNGLQEPIASALGLDASVVRIVAPAVGGGFGPKAGSYVEHLIVAKAAMMLGRPLKWTETRSENMLSMVHGRGQVQHVELGVKRDGEIVGLRATALADAGGYPSIGAFLPFFTRTMAQGVYRIPKIEFTVQSVVTNTTPTGAYRGAGRPEAASMLERILDMAASELGYRPGRDAPAQLLAAVRFPAHHRHRRQLRQR